MFIKRWEAISNPSFLFIKNKSLDCFIRKTMKADFFHRILNKHKRKCFLSIYLKNFRFFVIFNKMKIFTEFSLTRNTIRCNISLFKFKEVKPIFLKVTCLVLVLVLAVLNDLKSYKIPNQLVLVGLVNGLFVSVYEHGGTGVIQWIFGIFVPILLLAPLFLSKTLGAGDIKLFSVIGSFYGTAFVLKSILAALFVAAVMSVVQLIRHKQVFYRFNYFKEYIQLLVMNKQVGIKKGILLYYDRKRDGVKAIIHFSLAILVGFLIQIFYPF